MVVRMMSMRDFQRNMWQALEHLPLIVTRYGEPYFKVIRWTEKDYKKLDDFIHLYFQDTGDEIHVEEPEEQSTQEDEGLDEEE